MIGRGAFGEVRLVRKRDTGEVRKICSQVGQLQLCRNFGVRS